MLTGWINSTKNRSFNYADRSLVITTLVQLYLYEVQEVSEYVHTVIHENICTLGNYGVLVHDNTYEHSARILDRIVCSFCLCQLTNNNVRGIVIYRYALTQEFSYVISHVLFELCLTEVFNVLVIT